MVVIKKKCSRAAFPLAENHETGERNLVMLDMVHLLIREDIFLAFYKMGPKWRQNRRQ